MTNIKEYMNKTLLTVSALSVTLAVALFPNDATAHGDGEHKAKPISIKPANNRLFSDDDRRMIRDYYGHNYNGGYEHEGKKKKRLPPGLQKKYERTGELPPGWQKKLQRGEVMSIDVYRYGRPLPIELERRLPIGPVGSKVLEVEGKIIRVIENTREILDILDLGL